MRRAVLLLPLLALAGVAGANAVAQAPEEEPSVRVRDVFDMPGPCRGGDRVTVAVDPSGTELESVRVHVDGLLTVRITDVRSPATATVRIPSDTRTRVTATGDTIGGQALYRTRNYHRCGRRADEGGPVVGGGEG
jgi:hypothetical protein